MYECTVAPGPLPMVVRCRRELLEHHKNGSAGLVALGVQGAVGVEFELTFTAARAADHHLRRVGRHNCGLVSVVHWHREDGQHESRVRMRMLRPDDGAACPPACRNEAQQTGRPRSAARPAPGRGSRLNQAVDRLNNSPHCAGVWVVVLTFGQG